MVLLVRIKLLNYLLTSALSFLIVLGNVFPVNAGENALSSEVVSIKGELRKWHKVTLEVAGPEASEGGTLNPFLDIRLDVTFRQGQKEYVVPGYYAADGKAGESSASDGNVWKVHFAPDATGRWEYSVSFRKGSGIAVNGASGTSLSGDGASGSFTVGESNKQAPDNRARGRLEYVGERYLRYAETGEYFIKGGPDAPENFLAYADFDGTQNNDGISDELIKSWSAHKQDWRSGDASWQGGKGKGMIGALNYLAGQGLNVFSFLTLNILGDDKNVFPYVKYNGKLSGSPVEDRLRFDVSKLAQWEAVFEYAETLGMFLHIKLQETEVDELLDGGKLGVERKLYYREMIARFGHHLALNWNLGEEHMLYFKIGDKENKYLQQYGEYFYEQDPYHHHLVVHTRPDRKYKVYPYLLGDQSKLTGFSLQSYYSNVHADTRYWLSESEKAGRVWVTSNDEQGPAGDGLLPDGPGNNYDAIRKNVLWGNLMAGGSGCEFYFGYEHAQSDLSCEDWRSRSGFWGYVGHALSFFRDHVPYWEMAGADGLVGGGGNSNEKYCLAKEGEVYVVYLSNGGSTSIDLQEGSYTVKWYNPRKGGQLVEGSVKTITGSGVNIGTPPTEANQDWVALLERSGDVEMNISKFVLYDTESNSILADPLEDGAVIQADEKVSVVAVSEPTVVGSVQFKVNGQEAHVSNSMPYAIAGHSGGGSAAGAVEEEDGIALWEAESIPVQGEWKLEQQVKGYSGNGYYNWKGADYFKKPGNGILRYKVKVSKAGNYQFLFRTKNTFEISGEHNDSWVQLPSGENVAGEEPLNKDWVKVFQSQHRKWSWQARTVDHVDRPIRVYLEAGVHEVLLSGRSHGHAIDRIALFRYEEVNFSEDKFDGLPNSKQVGGEQVLHAWPLTIGTHSITATPFTGKNADGTAGKGISISVNVVDGNNTNIPPSTPNNLVANAVSASQIDLAWKDNAGDEEGFKVERSTNGGDTFTNVATVGKNTTTYSSKNLSGNTTYQYRVRAFNSAGNSSYSNVVTATTQADGGSGGSNTDAVSLLPEADSWVIGAKPGDNYGAQSEFKVRYANGDWTKESYLRFDLGNESGVIERAELILHVTESTEAVDHTVSHVSDDSWTEHGITWSNKPASASGYLDMARVTGTGAVTFDVTSKVQEELGSKISFLLQALQNVKPHIKYASKEHENVSFKPVLKITYTDEQPSVTIPAAANNLAANAVSASQIDLAWKDNSGDEEGFKVERSTNGGDTFTNVATVGKNTTTYSSKNLSGNTTYQYRVRAFNSAGNSSYSNVVTATTQADGGSGGSNTDAVSLLPEADSWVIGAKPGDNYGAQSEFKVRYANGDWTKESYLRFDLGNESGVIERAELILHVTESTEAVDHTVSYVSDDSWTEHGITWSNKPASASGYLDMARVTGTGAVTFDVTSKVQEELGDRVSFLVRAIQNVKPHIKYASKEHENVSFKPILKITYTEEGQEPPATVPPPVPTPEPEPAFAVTKLVLYNTKTDEIIGVHDPVQDGAIIDLDALGVDEISMEAITEPQTVGSVKFLVNGKSFRTENVAPYALNGDIDGNFGPWNFSTGKNTVTAIPYKEKKASGEKGEAMTVTITIKQGASLRVAGTDTKKKGESKNEEVAVATDNIDSFIEKETWKVVVYPNPVSDVLHIAASGSGTYSLYGLHGRMTRSGKISGGDATYINVSSLPSGVYYLKIATKEGVSSQKIMISR